MEMIGPLGLANKKTVGIAPGEGLSVTLTTTKLRQSSVLKKDFRKMAKTVVNQVFAFLRISWYLDLTSYFHSWCRK
jgi:hypothetical protein